MGKINACLSSDVKTASDAAIVIATTAGKLCGAQLIVKSTADPTLIIYDNASARSGTVLYKRKVDSSVEGLGKTDAFIPVIFKSGCTISYTGTDGADEAIVFYVTEGL
ncbi:hypothetical protein LCGC14_0619860 [marine sediment metagenome]|uniref:Uncharacterized protein n=1 Tax=marine sediment metagenome TaxID=412755 RepID=A0A0F9RA26_9ZZZZ